MWRHVRTVPAPVQTDSHVPRQVEIHATADREPRRPLIESAAHSFEDSPLTEAVQFDDLTEGNRQARPRSETGHHSGVVLMIESRLGASARLWSSSGLGK